MLNHRIPEITVISGKGGTGKTSLVASLAVLAEKAVIADCDVDAADLHLVLEPTIQETFPFVSGHEASVIEEKCDGCGECIKYCRFDAFRRDHLGNAGMRYRIDPLACEGCGLCRLACPAQAIAFTDRDCGAYHRSDTPHGPMVHARLHPGAENSGKLVSVVRKLARETAERNGAPFILSDGPPGIGCPVIAALSGTSYALIITEPTVSGEHDVKRVLELTHHFGIPSAVVVNRWDICPHVSDRIEVLALESGSHLLRRIPYDRAVTEAQVAGVPLVSYGDSPAADAVRHIWNTLETMLEEGLPERQFPGSLAELRGG